MSTLFKWELAALLLGGLLGFWQLAREEKRPFSALLRAWWSSERWLFCTGGENFRRAMAEPAAVIVLFALYFYGVLTGAFCAVSGFSEEWSFWGASQMVLLTAAFVLKTTLFTRYSGWQLVVMGAVMGYFALLQMITGYRPLAQAALLMVLLKDVDLKRCLRSVSYTHLSSSSASSTRASKARYCHKTGILINISINNNPWFDHSA